MRVAGLATVAIMMAWTFSTQAVAQDDSWPEGGAMNVGGLENKRLAAANALLARSVGRLLMRVAATTATAI